jgi:hypothetical protein
MRAGLSGGSPAGSGGRSCASGGSEPPVSNSARIRSLVSFWATLLALSHTVVVLRGCGGAKPACWWAPSLSGRSVRVDEVPETVAGHLPADGLTAPRDN